MISIVVDNRESYWVIEKLTDLGVEVIKKTITPADYVISSEYAVERKEFDDFMNSVFDGRLFEQVERLAKVYKKAYLLVEGPVTQGLSRISNPLIFWGALSKIIIMTNISIIFTLNEKHTAMFLYSLAKKLQEGKKKRINIKHKPKTYTLKQRQISTLQSLPNIGPERSKKLLKKFLSLRKIFNASDKELLSVEGLGRKTVENIKEILDTKYPGLELNENSSF
jgi:ERCC4-type nuclease